ncbi:hypothetical protein QJR36_07305 [Paraclostridium sordellii]|uniref:hypothetical protein n=1 Tax=Paraclostridium sordellii TaxID=1505 RepID=UPI0030CBD4A0
MNLQVSIGKVDVGIVMLYFSLIIDTTMFNLKWTLENGNGNYDVPTDYEIIGYCNI